MIPDVVVKQIGHKYNSLSPFLNERSRRLWAATEADALGYGGILALHRATGLSQNTIRAGVKELGSESTELLMPERIRQPGGGRKRVEEREPAILEALEIWWNPPVGENPNLLCAGHEKCQSTRALLKGIRSVRTVYTLLVDLGYSLQSNRKTKEGQQHPDRDEFQRIAHQSLSKPASSRDLD